jgi:hypothetical protein
MGTWRDFKAKHEKLPKMFNGWAIAEDPVPKEVREPWATRLFMLSCEGGHIKCWFDPQFHTFHFLGRVESWNMDISEPRDIRLVVSTFDRYCELAGKKPAYHEWCRTIVAATMLAALRDFFEKNSGREAARVGLQLLSEPRNNPTVDTVATELEALL